MTGSEIKEALRNGKRVLGTCIISPATRWLDLVPGLGLDFVFIDTEHIPINRERLSWMCYAYRGLNLAPVVRVPSSDPIQASMAIDGGAVGVIAPYLETPQQVRDLVGAVKYRPLKHSILGGILNGERKLDSSMKQYLEGFNEGNLVIANIESQPAIDALDEILQVEGLDAILIGPHDLSCSLGIPEQYDDPKFESTVRMILGKARAQGVGAGIHSWMGVEREIEWMKSGANFIIHSSDVYLFASTLKLELNKLKEAFGEAETDSSAPQITI